ncbi:hypothetical protein F5887DRAFT_920402 [Amanita rubescens]|nr:hypothetical protein F5887DRAFT_920402 [Amanita rubescens]
MHWKETSPSASQRFSSPPQSERSHYSEELHEAQPRGYSQDIPPMTESQKLDMWGPKFYGEMVALQAKWKAKALDAGIGSATEANKVDGDRVAPGASIESETEPDSDGIAESNKVDGDAPVVPDASIESETEPDTDGVTRYVADALDKKAGEGVDGGPRNPRSPDLEILAYLRPSSPVNGKRPHSSLHSTRSVDSKKSLKHSLGNRKASRKTTTNSTTSTSIAELHIHASGERCTVNVNVGRKEKRQRTG